MSREPPDSYLEIRRNDDGTIDEVVAKFADGTFHIEQMSNDVWSLGLSSNNRDDYVLLSVARKGKRVIVSVYDGGEWGTVPICVLCNHPLHSHTFENVPGAGCYEGADCPCGVRQPR